MVTSEQRLRGCRYCGLIHEITGCVHTRPAGFVDPGIPVTLGPGGTFTIEVTPVRIQVDHLGLPIMNRW